MGSAHEILELEIPGGCVDIFRTFNTKLKAPSESHHIRACGYLESPGTLRGRTVRTTVLPTSFVLLGSGAPLLSATVGEFSSSSYHSVYSLVDIIAEMHRVGDFFHGEGQLYSQAPYREAIKHTVTFRVSADDLEYSVAVRAPRTDAPITARLAQFITTSLKSA